MTIFIREPQTPFLIRYFARVMMVFCFVCLPSACLFAQEQITFVQDNGREVSFNIVLAITDEEQATGLMHVPEMNDGHGMLFIDKHPNYKSMWMKNTYIPLDMIFINDKGQVAYIHQRAIPHDLTTIRSPVPVIAVLEVNAGEVEKYNIQIGDRVKNFEKLHFFKKSLE